MAVRVVDRRPFECLLTSNSGFFWVCRNGALVHCTVQFVDVPLILRAVYDLAVQAYPSESVPLLSMQSSTYPQISTSLGQLPSSFTPGANRARGTKRHELVPWGPGVVSITTRFGRVASSFRERFSKLSVLGVAVRGWKDAKKSVDPEMR